jgi:hypothetical protein
MHGWLSGDGLTLSPNNGKAHTLCVRQKSTKTGLNLKEEVGQLEKHCPTSSNNCNVDSFYRLCSRGFINPLTGFSLRLRGKAALRRAGQLFTVPSLKAFPAGLGECNVEKLT